MKKLAAVNEAPNPEDHNLQTSEFSPRPYFAAPCPHTPARLENVFKGKWFPGPIRSGVQHSRSRRNLRGSCSAGRKNFDMGSGVAKQLMCCACVCHLAACVPCRLKHQRLYPRAIQKSRKTRTQSKHGEPRASTVDCRKVRDGKDCWRQVFIATRDIEPYERHFYPYPFTKGAGGWYEGVSCQSTPRDFLECIQRLRQERETEQRDQPCMSTQGFHMPQRAEGECCTPCPFCQEALSSSRA